MFISNLTTMIGNCQRNDGEVNIKPFKKKASTAFNLGDIVYQDSNGFLDKAAAATAASAIVGVIQENIKSTDSDYASTREVAVDMPRKGDNGDWFLAKVGAGTPAQTHVGETHDLDANGKVDLTANAVNVVKVQRIIDSTTVLVSFV